VARLSLQPSRDPADYEFSHRLRTRFAETDAMGVVHHAAYLPYLEVARVEYLRSIGHPYDAVRSAGDGDAPGGSSGSSELGEAAGREFPVLEVSLQYRRPLRFDDEVDVALRVGAVTRTTFQIAYLVSVGDEVRATAVTVHGCIDGRGRPARLPDWVAQNGRGS
jgi:acyl-CoA thioester hydrolase